MCPNTELFLVLIPVFGLNPEIYEVNLRIRYKYRKIRTRKTPYLDTFHAVLVQPMPRILAVPESNGQLAINLDITQGCHHASVENIVIHQISRNIASKLITDCNSRQKIAKDLCIEPYKRFMLIL